MSNFLTKNNRVNVPRRTLKRSCYNTFTRIFDLLKTDIDADEFLTRLLNCDKYLKLKNENLTRNIDVIHSLTDKCYRVTKKLGPEFYNNTYDPSWIPSVVGPLGIDLSIIDMEPKTNCSNVIAIALYSTGDIKRLKHYLYSMKQTLINVARVLPNFVVRYYLDASIFEVMNYVLHKPPLEENNNNDNDFNKIDTITLVKQRIFEILKFIINHNNSEIFIYFCNEIIEQMVNGKLNYKGPINNVRAFRLLPLLEKDTNVCVFREADGFVSLNDCHNIKYFAMSQTNKIGMIYEYGLTALNNLIYKQKEEYHHYNTWLNLEKVKLIKSFPDIKETILTLTYPINVLYIEKFGVFNFLDLLGGLFATKIKFKKEYIERKKKEINDFREIYLGLNLKNSIYSIFFAYDEILLNHIFECFTTAKMSIERKNNRLSTSSKPIKRMYYFDSEDLEKKKESFLIINDDLIYRYFESRKNYSVLYEYNLINIVGNYGLEEYFDIENYKSLYFEPLMYKLTEFNSSSSKDTKRLIDRMLLFDVVTHVGIEYKHYFINILLDKLYDFIKPLLKT